MSSSSVGEIRRNRNTTSLRMSKPTTPMRPLGRDLKQISFYHLSKSEHEDPGFWVVLLLCGSINVYGYSHLCNIYLDYSESMKVKCLESDSDEDNRKQKVEVKGSKNEPKQSHEASHNRRLDYQPDSSGSHKEEVRGVKSQPKIELNGPKEEVKNEKKLKGTLEYHGQREKKKEVNRLAYPPPDKEIPLKISKLAGKEDKNKKILDQTATDAKMLIHKMRALYKKDLEKYMKGELACQKVKYLSTLSEKLSNVYLKKEFIDQDGLRQMEKWLEKVVGEDRSEIEPCLAIRLGITKILREMNLTTEQIEKTKYLMSYVQRNRQSQVQELRELSVGLIKQWEYNIMTDSNERK